MPHRIVPATLIIIPTYNEAGNIEVTVANVQRALPQADILIVDDGSPDLTGDIADRLAQANAGLFVLHRKQKTGLGATYLAGFDWAHQHGYTLIGEFDADGSHPADALPRMMAAIESPARPSLVIGSRWARGGSVVGLPRGRELLSRGGNLYSRFMLQLPVADATAGFRLYRAEALRSIDLSSVDSRGYCFQIDLTRRLHNTGMTIVEVPIEFREREIGESKMSRSIVVEALLRVTVWGVQGFARRLLRRPASR